jgi:hypothetical protein
MDCGAKVDFPLLISQGRWRRRTRLLLGYTAAAVLRGRVKAIEAGNGGRPLSAADRLIVAALVHRALKHHQPLDHLAYLHRQLWNSEEIIAYHAGVEKYFWLWFLPHQSAIVDLIEQDLERAAHGRFHTLCEIGTGSGLVLDHLRQRLHPHGIATFCGLDLCAAQVAKNAARFPQCAFIAADACQWLPEHAAPGWIYFCCGGVLEYLPEGAVAALFAATAARPPARWAIVEPVDEDQDSSAPRESRPFGVENTWSHDYAGLCGQAGLTVLASRDLHIDGVRWRLMLAGN